MNADCTTWLPKKRHAEWQTSGSGAATEKKQLLGLEGTLRRGRRAGYAEDREFEDRFERLANEWEIDTERLSTFADRVLHPAYQRIIGLGPRAIPCLLRRLEKRPADWFWALRCTSGENPAEGCGRNFSKMRDAWLKWGTTRYPWER